MAEQLRLPARAPLAPARIARLSRRTEYRDHSSSTREPMAYLVPLFLGICAVLAIVLALLSRNGMHAAFSALAAELARRGIHFRGMIPAGAWTTVPPTALDLPQRGILLERADGLRASLSPNATQGAATVPGFGPIAPMHTLVEVDSALPDQMICAPDRAQGAFGPFPPAPLRTGHPGFDQRFAIYARVEEGNSYRPAPPNPAPWARSAAAPLIFSNLHTLGFVAMHVHGGRARILFAPLPVDGMVSAMDTASMIAGAHEARRPAPIPTPLRTGSPPSVVLAIVFFVFQGFGIPLLPHVTETGLALAGSEIACPNGGTFKKGYRNRSDQCKLPNGKSYASASAYQAWQFAFWSAYNLAVLGAGSALYFRHRRNNALAMTKNLAT
ncbi:hypothetical protein [Polyangium sp. 6x1]|uniref:hypothetical protein n=1 Tax=Polyangium sp. 6x1 TaxID=3042689 RepID=UPI0024825038|nr:hypothetical protein [Polyangium sp. 6x1]MDI1444069.1 hypothetical protein [Polyangium sp. 6x1]